MKPHPRTFLPIAIGLALVMVAACGQGATSPSTPSGPSAQPGAPSPTSTPTDSGPETPDPSFEALVAEAIQVRTMLGLRADEAWVRSVSRDPSVVTDYGIPITRDEQATLDARAAWRVQLAPILEEYAAAHRDEYAGTLIDNEADGAIVILFTDHLADHAAALGGLVPREAPLQVRLAPVSERDLEGLMEQFTGDAGLLRSIGVALVTITPDPETGRLVAEVSTERDDVDGLFAARYGPIVEVRVLDPTGAYVKPPGAIVGQVVDESGTGVPAAIGSQPLFADLPLDAVGPPETNPDGTFRLDEMLPGPWRITAYGDGFEPVSLDVEVPPGGTATVELVVDPGS